MPVARPESSDSRVIAHVDMDCFYVQGFFLHPISFLCLYTYTRSLLVRFSSMAYHSEVMYQISAPLMLYLYSNPIINKEKRGFHSLDSEIEEPMEQRKQPHLRGQPTAVVQYNSWQGGGLIAVGYEARKDGVKRSMRGDEAKKVCPQIHLVQVPVARGKADLNIYRSAGSEVVSILSRKGRCERASIDEVYLDLTEASEKMLKETPPESLENIHEEVLKSHVLGLIHSENDNKDTVKQWLQQKDGDHRDKLLACGALIVAELRLQVLQETEFTCSAGIAHNKMLAKLASGMNKPAQQTIVPFSSVKELLETLPIKKMKQLGGKLGSSLQVDLGVNTVSDLLQFSEEKLQDLYGVNTGTWLWNTARGMSGEEVEGRLLPKSHGSGKTFRGPSALKTLTAVESWLKELCEELSERLHTDMETNKRIAHTLTLHATAYKCGDRDRDTDRKFPSKSCPLRYGAGKVLEDAVNLFQCGLREYMNHQSSGGWRITGLSVSASKIVDIPSGTCSITKYFHCKGGGEKGVPKDDILSPSKSDIYSDCKQTEFGEITQDENETSVDRCESSCKNEATCEIGVGPESCSTLSQNESQKIKETKKINNKITSSVHHKTKPQKEKGTSSILKFLQTNTSSSSKCLPSEVEEASERLTASQNTWSYNNLEEIDQSVLKELPPEIQEEFRTLIRPKKRANTVKRGSSIAHYFSPK
ncbi:hypothetical protein LXL04_014298 [Taraxacum kok-saghyz]